MPAMTAEERRVERRFAWAVFGAAFALHLVGGALAVTMVCGCRLPRRAVEVASPPPTAQLPFDALAPLR